MPAHSLLNASAALTARAGSPVWWNAYPALLCAGAVAAGILTSAWLPAGTLSFWAWMAGAGAALLAAGVFLWRHPRRLVSPAPLVWTAAVLAACAALGAARLQQDRAVPPSHMAHLVVPAGSLAAEGDLEGAGHSVTLEGWVDGTPRRSRRSTRFRLAVRHLIVPSATARTDTLAAMGLVMVALHPSAWDTPDAPFPPVAEGDRLRLRGELRAPAAPRNPGGFDYGAYLRRRGIHATMRIYDPAGVTITGRRRSAVNRFVVPARHYVERQLARHVRGREEGGEARAVLRALLLGDRSSLPGATEDRFARSGLMHLLAVSGLHVLLVGWLFYQGLRPMLLRARLGWRGTEHARAALTLLALAFYVLLAGAPASATRATVMAALLMGATLAQRPARSLNALGAAAAMLLLWRPAQLFEAGFQLSFAAVGAIVLIVPVAGRWVPAAWEERPALRWAAQSTLTTVAATLGTLPVLLGHFGRVPFAGLLLNLWAIPLMAVVLVAGLCVVVFGGTAAPLATAAGAVAEQGVAALAWTARLGDTTASWTLLRHTEAGPWTLAAAVALLLMLAAWPRPRLRWRLLMAALVLGCAGVWPGVLRGGHAPRLDALFFDVGHGDAALLSLPGGAHVLIDAGARSPVGDAARRTVLPHLERRGIRRLGAVILSHPDGDHLGGLPSLLRGVEVGRLITGGDTAATALFAETQHLLDSLRVPVRVARAGDTLRLGPHVRTRVLAPTRGLVETASENDASLALHLAYGRTRFLFTGDAEARTETLLAAHYGTLLQSEALNVGHHGSPTSSLPAFVQAAAAEGTFAVASSGTRFALPNRVVLDRWRAAGGVPLATADEGGVWLRSDGHRVRRVRWRRGER